LQNKDWATFLDEVSRKGVGVKRNNAVIVRGYGALDSSIGDVDIPSLFQDTSIYEFENEPITRKDIQNGIEKFRHGFLKHQKKKAE
jgi:hypothetical protein